MKTYSPSGDITVVQHESPNVNVHKALTSGHNEFPLNKVMPCHEIDNLETLREMIVSFLYNRKDVERLSKCKLALESYVGTDWQAYCQDPRVHEESNRRGYSRVKIAEDEDFYSLLLLTWAPCTASAVHNHPCERCFLMPLSGDLWELMYVSLDEPRNRFMETKRTKMENNTAYWINDSIGWHRIENKSTNISMSLHLYVPPIWCCKVVDLVTEKVSWANCFSQTCPCIGLDFKLFESAQNHFKSLTPPSCNECNNDFSELQDGHKRSAGKVNGWSPSLGPLEIPSADDDILSGIYDACETLQLKPPLLNEFPTDTDGILVAAECLACCLNADMLNYTSSEVYNKMEITFLQHLAGIIGWNYYDCSRDSRSNNGMPTVLTDLNDSTGCISTPSILLDRDCTGTFVADACMANMAALSTARNEYMNSSMINGLYSISGAKKLIAFTSANSCSTIKKAMGLIGLGTANIIDVPVRSDNSMDTVELEKLVKEQINKGETPFFVNCMAGEPLTGAFDSFVEISQICEKYGIWMHVDGSVGASFFLPKEDIFSQLMSGIQRANSITWGFGELLGRPIQFYATLIRLSGSACEKKVWLEGSLGDRGRLQQAFDCVNLYHSGRSVDFLKVWCFWKKLGDLGMANRVRMIYARVTEFLDVAAAFPRLFTPSQILHSGECLDEKLFMEEKSEHPDDPSDMNCDAFVSLWKPCSFSAVMYWIPYDLRGKVRAGGVNAIRNELNIVGSSLAPKVNCSGLIINCRVSDVLGYPKIICLTFLKPTVTRLQMFNMLKYINSIGMRLFPKGSFSAA